MPSSTSSRSHTAARCGLAALPYALPLYALPLYALLAACGLGHDEPPTLTAEHLFSGKPLHVAIELPLEAMAALAKHPRQYVQGAVALVPAGERKGVRFEDVALRFKGNRSLRSWHDKPAFKLHFAKKHKARRVAGLETLVLNNMVEDPTMVREALGYAVFRALAVPAPRTGYAEVFVNGERFGLYALIEPTETPLLSRHFGRHDGPVYEGEYGCDLYPDDLPALELDSGEDDGRRHLRALVEAAHGPLEALLHGPDALVHEDNLLGFLAGSALLSDFDGYRHAHNYRMYYDPSAKRWSMLPWGLDRVLRQEMALFDSHGSLAQRCFSDAECRTRYVQRVREGAAVIDKLDLRARLEAIELDIGAAVARDRKRPYTDAQRRDKLAELRTHLQELPARMARATACLDGDADGDGHACMDCDDGDASTHPAATELCDGRDNDCSGVVDDAPECACPEHVIDGVAFSVCDRPVPWPRAAALCEQQGATLAHITTKAQAQGLAAIAKKLRADHYWIGLNDRQREGHPVWDGGARKGHARWDRGEPDDYACGQDCAALADGKRGRYRDMHCASPRPFICSRPAPQP